MTSRSQHDSQNEGNRKIAVSEFVLQLKRCRLFTDTEWPQLEEQFLKAELHSATDLSKQLIDAGRLTLFQAEQLLRGDSRPLVLGDYCLQSELGRGGMGTVYLAVHRRMKRRVAIKILRQDLANSSELARRFLREVEVAAKLCHPNIVTAYDAGEQQGINYLVFEFVDGQNLAEIVKQYGPLSLPLATDVILQAAKALEYAHAQGVIHRDIKPSNLLLDDDGNVKVLDVGLARLSCPMPEASDQSTELTVPGMLMGTVDYISPEQARNTRLANELSDVYSLGCTFYFLLTGQPPFGRGTAIERLLAHTEKPVPSLRKLCDEVPVKLDLLLQQMMAKLPSKRTASMSELIRRLEKLKDDGLPEFAISSLSHENSDPSSADLFAESDGLLQTRLTSESSLERAAMSGTSAPSAIVQPLQRTGKPGRTIPAKKPFPTAWIALPAFLAVSIVLVMVKNSGNTNSDDQPVSADDGKANSFKDDIGEARDRTSIPDTQPALRQLSSMSEDEVRQYRTDWSMHLGVPETRNVNGIEFVLIPAGIFLPETDQNAAPVVLERSYYLSATEVTVQQFRRFADAFPGRKTTAETDGTGWGINPTSGQWVQSPLYSWRNIGAQFISDQHPVGNMTWHDAIAFCRWVSESAMETIRLPTEHEWEYACRCGRRGNWGFGNDEHLLSEYAWFRENSEGQIHPVAGKKPNAWGLYDMHGNEFEWCQIPDEQAAFGQGIMRGGGFLSTRYELQSSRRLRNPLNSPTHGAFRILLQIN